MQINGRHIGSRISRLCEAMVVGHGGDDTTYAERFAERAARVEIYRRRVEKDLAAIEEAGRRAAEEVRKRLSGRPKKDLRPIVEGIRRGAEQAETERRHLQYLPRDERITDV